MVEAAQKYGRIVQAGTQCRSNKGIQDAIAFLRSGKLGKIYMAKGLCYKPRGSIGHKADAPVPAGVDYNLWLGPAPERPFNPNRFHYDWHWNWDYGNGDLGNQGIHQMDLARWGLGKNEFPKTVIVLRRPLRLLRRRPDPEHPARRLRVRRLRAPVRGPRAARPTTSQGQDRRHLLRHRGDPGDHQLHELADLLPGRQGQDGARPRRQRRRRPLRQLPPGRQVARRQVAQRPTIEEGHSPAPTATWATSPTGSAASCTSTPRPSRSSTTTEADRHADPRLPRRCRSAQGLRAPRLSGGAELPLPARTELRPPGFYPPQFSESRECYLGRRLFSSISVHANVRGRSSTAASIASSRTCQLPDSVGLDFFCSFRFSSSAR